MTATDEQIKTAIEEAVGMKLDELRRDLPRTFAALQRRMTDPVAATVQILTEGPAYEALKALTADETDARKIAGIVATVVAAAIPQIAAML